ncbi:MAG: 50S ribosomal protein L25 [Bryobacteraceae bacterium]
MRKDITIVAEPRETRGKNEARRLRMKSQIAAIVYGAEKDPVAVAVSPKEVAKILGSNTGHNTIFNLEVAGGETTPVMIIDWQIDPVKSFLLHADFKRIDLTKRIFVKVPVHTEGEPKGVKIQGGLFEAVTREIEIECLPDDIPEAFTVNVVEFMLGQALRAGDIPMTGSMKLTSPADQVISHVVAPKAEAAATTEEAATPAAGEPEVVKKGKKDEEAPAADAKKKK